MNRATTSVFWRRFRLMSLVLLVVAVSTACGKQQMYASVQFDDIALPTGKLQQYGLGFITPSTITGREQDIQSLAFIFARVMEEQRPDIRVVRLPETLSAVNQAGLADDYKEMYVDYSDTGIFKFESLRQVGEVTGVRYLAQLKLSSFKQASKGRFSFLGLRVFQTKEANVRMFFQIWDSHLGSIVWEGTEELNYAWDTASEKPVTFQLAVGEIARNLISKLPADNAATTDLAQP